MVSLRFISYYVVINISIVLTIIETKDYVTSCNNPEGPEANYEVALNTAPSKEPNQNITEINLTEVCAQHFSVRVLFLFEKSLYLYVFTDPSV